MTMIPIVNLKAKAKLNEISSRAFPLADAPILKDSAKIIDFLKVEKSARYQPNSTQTFCNIYAYDYAMLFGAYLPRVWWKEEAIKANKFDVIYGKTVIELNVNALYEWFQTYSKNYGWREVTSKSEAQKLANNGKCVVILAANKLASKSGHIVAVVKETEKHKALYANGLCDKICAIPLQSNAGRVNKEYFCSEWWKTNHKPIKIYVHE